MQFQQVVHSPRLQLIVSSHVTELLSSEDSILKIFMDHACTEARKKKYCNLQIQLIYNVRSTYYTRSYLPFTQS